MATKETMKFPRINFVALLAAALSFVSVFLYWWGLNTTGFISDSFQWSLWSGPSRLYVNSANSAQTLTNYSPLIGALVVGSAVLLLIGTIPRASRLLIVSSILSVLAPIVYAFLINYAVSSACSGMSNCISGPFGTETVTAGPFTTTVTWGFQAGFYLEIVGAVLSIVAIAFQRTFLPTKTSPT
jgi:hypothetical protein